MFREISEYSRFSRFYGHPVLVQLSFRASSFSAVVLLVGRQIHSGGEGDGALPAKICSNSQRLSLGTQINLK